MINALEEVQGCLSEKASERDAKGIHCWFNKFYIEADLSSAAHQHEIATQ